MNHVFFTNSVSFISNLEGMAATANLISAAGCLTITETCEGCDPVWPHFTDSTIKGDAFSVNDF